MQNYAKIIIFAIKKITAMKEKEIKTLIKVYDYEELSAEDRELVDAAKAMTRTSYAPYSKFHVGAAIRMDGGEIVTGSNQENAAYPSGTCAERTRLHHEDSDPDEDCFQRLPVSPCGACRQALLEYEALYGDIEVILYGRDCVYVLPSVKSLLPLSFTEF